MAADVDRDTETVVTTTPSAVRPTQDVVDASRTRPLNSRLLYCDLASQDDEHDCDRPDIHDGAENGAFGADAAPEVQDT